MLSRTGSKRIGKLPDSSRPAHRDLVSGLPHQGQKGTRNILGLIQKRSWIKRATGYIRAVYKAGSIYHRRKHAADMDVPLRRKLLSQARCETTQAELARCVSRSERC